MAVKGFPAYHPNNAPIAAPTFSIDGIIAISKVELSGTAGMFSAPIVRTGASRLLKHCS